MQYFGKILGIIIGLLSGIGLWGLIIGLIIGYIADKITNNQINNQFINKKYQNLFFNITFQVMGHLTKSKGRVTDDDIKMALLLMKQMNLNEQLCYLAKKSFNEGKNNNYPLKQKLRELKKIGFWKEDLIKIFLEIQIRTALSDGILHDEELNILYIISDELGISRNQLNYILHTINKNTEFDKNNFFNQDTYDENNNYFYKNYKEPSYNLKNAYFTLGVNSDDNSTIIKRSYKKLMSKYHPDKLVGSPLEVIEKAKNKTQEIQIAYDLIKRTRGFK